MLILKSTINKAFLNDRCHTRPPETNGNQAELSTIVRTIGKFFLHSICG